MEGCIFCAILPENRLIYGNISVLSIGKCEIKEESKTIIDIKV